MATATTMKVRGHPRTSAAAITATHTNETAEGLAMAPLATVTSATKKAQAAATSTKRKAQATDTNTEKKVQAIATSTERKARATASTTTTMLLLPQEQAPDERRLIAASVNPLMVGILGFIMRALVGDSTAPARK